MGTRSRIGVMRADGSIESIYCHWDGYPAHVGKTLMESYKDPGKRAGLIALGDISSLGPELGEKHADDANDKESSNFDVRAKNWTTAYGRDRGEEGVEAKTSDNAASWIKLFEEYNYLWFEGQWHLAVQLEGETLGVLLTPMDDVLQDEEAVQ